MKLPFVILMSPVCFTHLFDLVLEPILELKYNCFLTERKKRETLQPQDDRQQDTRKCLMMRNEKRMRGTPPFSLHIPLRKVVIPGLNVFLIPLHHHHELGICFFLFLSSRRGKEERKGMRGRKKEPDSTKESIIIIIITASSSNDSLFSLPFQGKR